MWSVTVPAKALLFGEYGLLAGHPGVVATFFDPVFRLSLEERPLHQGARFESAFLPGGFVQMEILTLQALWEEMGGGRGGLLPGQKLSAKAPHLSRDEVFWASCLLPWAPFLNGKGFCVCVHESWSPDLGFGSSSALMAGVHVLLESFLGRFCTWNDVQFSLKSLQGKGSGYDVAAQMAALRQPLSKTQMWIFERGEVSRFTPEFSLSQLGVLVPSGIYSDTSAVLHAQGGTGSQGAFEQAHGEIAKRFIASPRLSTLKSLFQESLAVAHRQGIVPRSDVTDALVRSGVCFKTTGAGAGDCLWALPEGQTLPAQLAIAHDFQAETKTND